MARAWKKISIESEFLVRPTTSSLTIEWTDVVELGSRDSLERAVVAGTEVVAPEFCVDPVLIAQAHDVIAGP